MSPVKDQIFSRSTTSESSSRMETGTISKPSATARSRSDLARRLFVGLGGRDRTPDARCRRAPPPDGRAATLDTGTSTAWQNTMPSAPRRTPSSARPPPRSSFAPSMRPGISTSCTSTPPMRVVAGTGRGRGERVVARLDLHVATAPAAATTCRRSARRRGRSARPLAGARRCCRGGRSWYGRGSAPISSLTHLRRSAYGPFL